MKEIKVTFKNTGFTFTIDFTENAKEAKAFWTNYYNSIGAENFEIKSRNMKNFKKMGNYFRAALTLFGEDFPKLEANQKLSIAEYLREVA